MNQATEHVYDSLMIRQSRSGDSWLVRLVNRLFMWQERHRQRRALWALSGDDDFLHDIGISRVDAVREARKPFWRS